MSLSKRDRDASVSSRSETSHEGISQTRLSVETRADRQILDRLIASFDSDGSTMDVSAVSFFVRNRTVTVNGIIRDQPDRDLLLSIIRRTDGVERVIDRLRIAPHRFRSRIFRRSA
jgi:osmotically-inducible protein OsmY